MGVLPSISRLNMQFLLLTLFPLSSALSGSHVSVTMGDTTYSHGDEMEFNHFAPQFSSVPSPFNHVNHASQVNHANHANHVHHINRLNHANNANHFNHVNHANHVNHVNLAPIRFLHDPVVVSRPNHIQKTPAFDTAPEFDSVIPFTAFSPAPALSAGPALTPASAFPLVPAFVPGLAFESDIAIAPVPEFVPAQAPAFAHAPGFAFNPSLAHGPANAPSQAYAGYGTAPLYQATTMNCSVISELTTAEVCTPTLQTTCGTMEMPVKTLTNREQCMNITHTVCSKSEEELVNEICVYSYQNKTEDTMATNYEIAFEKECKTQKVSVCQPSADYEDGEQDCKEEEQETCYNVPMVLPKQETLTVTYPEPMMDCKQKPITIPRVTCEDVTEEMCTIVPDIMNDIVMMEKCG